MNSSSSSFNLSTRNSSSNVSSLSSPSLSSLLSSLSFCFDETSRIWSLIEKHPPSLGPESSAIQYDHVNKNENLDDDNDTKKLYNSVYNDDDDDDDDDNDDIIMG